VLEFSLFWLGFLSRLSPSGRSLEGIELLIWVVRSLILWASSLFSPLKNWISFKPIFLDYFIPANFLSLLSRSCNKWLLSALASTLSCNKVYQFKSLILSISYLIDFRNLTQNIQSILLVLFQLFPFLFPLSWTYNIHQLLISCGQKIDILLIPFHFNPQLFLSLSIKTLKNPYHFNDHKIPFVIKLQIHLLKIIRFHMFCLRDQLHYFPFLLLDHIPHLSNFFLELFLLVFKNVQFFLSTFIIQFTLIDLKD